MTVGTVVGLGMTSDQIEEKKAKMTVREMEEPNDIVLAGPFK